MRPLPVLEIDGARFNDLEGFWDEVSRQLIPGAEWGRNLDASMTSCAVASGRPRTASFCAG